MLEFDWAGYSPSGGEPPRRESYLMFQALENETDRDRKLRMLRQVSKSCMACSMCELGRQPASRSDKVLRDPHVFSNMNPTEFLVVGQGPGWEEVVQCEPFVGPSGDNFGREIAIHGLSRDDFYICNTIRCFVPGNGRPSARNILRCRPFLEMEISLLRPKLVITLGSVAFEQLCHYEVTRGLDFSVALKRITNSVDYDVPVFAAYHPSPENLDDQARREAFADQMRVMCALIHRIRA